MLFSCQIINIGTDCRGDGWTELLGRSYAKYRLVLSSKNSEKSLHCTAFSNTA